MQDKELAACAPAPVDRTAFNPKAKIPYGVTTDHIRLAMEEYVSFLGFVNSQLHTKKIDRLESFLMPANFSSIVGEFVGAAIPKYCKTVCRNLYHNGHPDYCPKVDLKVIASNMERTESKSKDLATTAVGRGTTPRICG